MASMLAPSTPRSATSSIAASTTFLWAVSLRVRAISDLDLRKQTAADQEEHGRTDQQHRGVSGQAEVRDADEADTQPVDAVGQGVERGDDAERGGQVVQRIQRAGQEEYRHHQEAHDHLKSL